MQKQDNPYDQQYIPGQNSGIILKNNERHPIKRGRGRPKKAN
jgi:hypothetical protein